MGGLLHRKLFDLISMPTVRGQGSLLRWYFDWWHRRPDPWGYATEPYEIYKYGKTLEHLHGRDYKRILDVACSEGVFTSQLAATYPHASVDGVDISARAVSRARARNGSTARFHEMDLLTDQPDGDFDLVICGELLYYMGRDKRLRLISERLALLLAPGGLLTLIHPWPDSRHLYRYLETDPRLALLNEHIDEFAKRRFAVTLYERVS